MPVEAGTTIADLNPSNPPSGDVVSQADDHLRLIKALIKATFPNINAVLNITDEQLNEYATKTVAFAAGGATTPSVALADATLGFYKKSTGQIGISTGSVLRGEGTVECGALQSFPKAPAGLGTASVPGTRFDKLELNGALYLIADYPDLFAFLSTTFGGNGSTTFGVPDWYTLGKFPRSRTAAVAVGTAQTNAIKSHVHPVTGTVDPIGNHNHGGATGDDSPDHTHQSTISGSQGGGRGTSAPFDGWNNGTANTATSGASTRHQHAIGNDGSHAHGFITTSSANTGADTETRPEAFAVIYTIKT